MTCENKTICDVKNEEILDLEDLILFDLGNTVLKASKILGSTSVSVKLPNGEAVFDRPKEDPSEGFFDRLHRVLISAQEISRKSKIEYETIASMILVLDGWSWNDAAFRAPIWMYDHREIPLDEAKEIGGLSWLKGSSLEIKSKQNMVLGGLNE